MIVTICGPLSFYQKGAETKQELEALGYDVLWPWGMEELLSGKLRLDKMGKFKETNQGKAIKVHYDKITQGDAVLIVNEEKNRMQGYIGGNTLMEMGFAFVLDKPIYVLNPLPKESPYLDELQAMKPVMLNGDLEKIGND